MDLQGYLFLVPRFRRLRWMRGSRDKSDRGHFFNKAQCRHNDRFLDQERTLMVDKRGQAMYASNVRPSRDGSSFDVYPAHGFGPSFTVNTLHISCKSDTYRGSKQKYGGIIIYSCNGKTDWYTANGTHCKSGYVVIMRTDTKEFQEQQNKWRERGIVHGTIYRIAFGESCDDVTVVGEGFGIIDGKFKTTSGAFNPAHDDDYDDNTVYMHPDSSRYVEAVVNIWKRAGPNFPAKQNYSVKELGD